MVTSWGGVAAHLASNKPWEWYSCHPAQLPVPSCPSPPLAGFWFRRSFAGLWFLLCRCPCCIFCFGIGGAIHRVLSRAHMEGTDEAKTLRATLQPQCPQQWDKGGMSIPQFCVGQRGQQPPCPGEGEGAALRSSVYAGKTGFSCQSWSYLGSVDSQSCAGAFFFLSTSGKFPNMQIKFPTFKLPVRLSSSPIPPFRALAGPGKDLHCW